MKNKQTKREEWLIDIISKERLPRTIEEWDKFLFRLKIGLTDPGKDRDCTKIGYRNEK